MAMIEEFQAAGADVVQRLSPGVVRIGRGPGRGAGILISSDSVVTNAHNLRGAETTVTFADGEGSVGTVAGIDLDHDLAVLRIEAVDRPVPSWGADAPGLGAAVFVVTAPADVAIRLSFGMISALDRAFRGPRGQLIRGGIEHTAPLARGSSGSPVVDLQGRVLGLNTLRLGEGFYLALPADEDLRSRVEALARGESPRRRYLGVSLYPARAALRLRSSVGLPERDGLLVRTVDTDGPAGRAGVREGDLLIAAGDTPIVGPDDLFDALAGVDGNAPLRLAVVRGSEEIQFEVSFEGPSKEGSA